MTVVRIPVPTARLTLEALRFCDGVPGVVIAQVAVSRFTVVREADHFVSSGGTDEITRAAAQASEATEA